MTNVKWKITWLYAAIAVVALVGLADAMYLTIQHLSGANLQCSVISGCDEVLASRYAKIGKFPLSGLGAVAYFLVFSLATLIAFDYRGLKIILLAIVSMMALTSIWLIYLQAFVIRHFCQYCLLSAAVCFTLFGLALFARFKERQKLA